MSFYDPQILDPNITLFSKCRYCQKLIGIEFTDDNLILNERKCPHCEIFLEEQDLFNGLIKNFSYTQAYLSAQKIISFDLVVIPFICVNLLVFWIGFPSWFRIIFGLIPYTSPIIFCVKWFRQHYWFDHLTDEEYISAVKDVKKSLLIWIFAKIFCWILLFF